LSIIIIIIIVISYIICIMNRLNFNSRWCSI